MPSLTLDSPIVDVLLSLPPAAASVRDKLLNQKDTLDGFGFTTPGSILGSLMVQPPPDYDLRRRCMTADAQRNIALALNVDSRMGQLGRLLHLPPADLDRWIAYLGNFPQPNLATKLVESEGHFGITPRQRLRTGRDYHIVDASRFLSKEPARGGRLLLPDLVARIGPAWDQMQRGTCTAFAMSGLVHYLRGIGGDRPSTQFMYHNCKMCDGFPNIPGTYLETAARVVADRNLSGYGYDWGIADVGFTNESTWPYENSHYSLSESNEGHSPPPPERRAALYQSVRWGNTSGEVIRTSSGSNSIIRELRCLVGSLNIPVVVGVDIFPSWNNPNTRRTGRITLPFGNERSVGAHALLVVGYDDTEGNGTFLCRNSWSTGWAYDNPWQMSGYCLIPYSYMARYSQRAYAMRSMSRIDQVNIPEARRLYNRRNSANGIQQLAGKPAPLGHLANPAVPAARRFWGIGQPLRRRRSLLARIFRR